MSETTILPKVEKAMGVHFDSIKDEVSLSFESDGKQYVIPFRAAEIFKSEEWFIQVRQHIGYEIRKRQASSNVENK